MNLQPFSSQALTKPRTASQALAAWETILEDLDTLWPAYLDEPNGEGPMHDALSDLGKLILSYAPATTTEAQAILAITDHDWKAGLKWTDRQQAARDRAKAFLRSSGNWPEVNGHA